VVKERRHRGRDSRLTTKHVGCTVVAVVVVVGAGRAIALKATDASVDDTVDEIFGLRVLVVGWGGVSLRREKRRVCDVRSTAKHGAVAVLVGRAIAWKTTDALVDDIVDGIVGVRVVLVVRVRVNLVEERQQQGLDWRLTTKHVGGTVVVVVVVVVVVGRAIAWNATDASLDDTVDGIFGVGVLAVCVLVDLVVRGLSNLPEEQQYRGWDLRLTTKRGVVAVVVGLVVDTVVGDVCDSLVVRRCRDSLLQEKR